MEINKKILTLKEKMIDDRYRHKFQLSAFSAGFAVLALFMTLINLMTYIFGGDSSRSHEVHALMVSTFFFMILMIVSYLLATFFKSKSGQTVAKTVFSVAIISLFTFFLLTGGTQGFSTYWILLLPITAMIILGLRDGCILSGAFLIVILFFLYTPVGNNAVEACANALQNGYVLTDAFKYRFPVVYLACTCVGVFLEVIRKLTYKELIKTSEMYKKSSYTDSLTGLNNQTFISEFAKNLDKYFEVGDVMNTMFIDIDDFKYFNECYGHLFGNIVIHGAAQSLLVKEHLLVARWGGDEFLIIDKNKSIEEFNRMAEDVRMNIQCLKFDEDTSMHITVSVGVHDMKITEDFNFSKAIEVADNMQRIAKENGKNCVVRA